MYTQDNDTNVPTDAMPGTGYGEGEQDSNDSVVLAPIELVPPEPQTPEEATRRAGWNLWLLWMLANIAASLVIWGLNYVMGFLWASILSSPRQDLPNWGWTVATAINSLLSGGIFGVAQWLVLRRYLATIGWRGWVSATALGQAASYLLNFILGTAIFAALDAFVFSLFRARNDSGFGVISLTEVVSAAIFVAIIGWAQWLVLRYHVRRAGWWIVAAVIGTILAQVIHQIAFDMLINASTSTDTLTLTLTLLNFLVENPLSFAINGLALVFLLRRPNAHIERANEHSIAPYYTPNKFAQRARLSIIWGNLLVGSFLWFFYVTDYSLPGTILDILFPPFALILGIAAFCVARHAFSTFEILAYRISALPSIAGGAFYVLAAGLMFLSPFQLRGFFLTDEIKSETLIQQVASPDGSRIAEVYYRPGGYGGATYKSLFVRVHYSLLPIIERDIAEMPTHMEGEGDTTNIVKWSDNDTLNMQQRNWSMELGLIKLETPLVFAQIPFLFARWGEIEQEQKHNEVNTTDVKSVPTYPATLDGDQSQVTEDDNQFRSYNIDDKSASEIADWYKQALSVSPWSFERMDQYSTEDSGGTHFRYCVQAHKGDSGQGQPYYVEILAGGDISASVHVNVGTPKPLTDACKRFVTQP